MAALEEEHFNSLDQDLLGNASCDELQFDPLFVDWLPLGLNSINSLSHSLVAFYFFFLSIIKNTISDVFSRHFHVTCDSLLL